MKTHGKNLLKRIIKHGPTRIRVVDWNFNRCPLVRLIGPEGVKVVRQRRVAIETRSRPSASDWAGGVQAGAGHSSISRISGWDLRPRGPSATAATERLIPGRASLRVRLICLWPEICNPSL